MKMSDEEQVLKKMGLDFHILDDGCCGMAGSFGFEAEHYDVSVRVGELELLPAVRQAAKDELIIANGFSCMEQIEQTTDRQALHLAQVIQMARHDGERGPAGAYPERHYPKVRGAFAPATPLPTTGLLLGAGLLAGGWMLWNWSRRPRANGHADREALTHGRQHG
jgi:hypothetical protein